MVNIFVNKIDVRFQNTCARSIVTSSLKRKQCHDDVIKWKHFPRYWPFLRRIHRSPVNSPHKGQWRGALMFSLIWTWTNSWVNNPEAGDLRRNRAHCDVSVMVIGTQSRCVHIVIYGLIMSYKNVMYALLCWNVHAFARYYLGVSFCGCFPTQELNTKITFTRGHKQFAAPVHILFSLYSKLKRFCHIENATSFFQSGLNHRMNTVILGLISASEGVAGLNITS